MNLSRNYEGSRSVGNSQQKKKRKENGRRMHTTNVKPTEALSLKTQKKDYSPTTDCYGDKNES